MARNTTTLAGCTDTTDRRHSTAPAHRRREAIIDGWMHVSALAGAAAASVVLLALAIRPHDAQVVAGTAAYVAGLLVMLTCSTLYHLARPSLRKELFRRFDHAAIFVMIAGTYTPFALTISERQSGRAMLVLVWGAAIAGALMKLLYPRRFDGVSIALYLALGWSGLAVIDALIATLTPSTLALLLAGGILYSGGVAFHLLRGLPNHKVVWHGCVIAAAACHYAAVVSQVVAARVMP